MKKFLAITLLSAAVATAISCGTQPSTKGPAIWDIATIDAKAARINGGEKIDFYEALKHNADSILLVERNPSVTYKPTSPNSGDIHDYMSLARYWWPNPDSDDSMPYIRKDGVSNPELQLYDRPQLGEFCESINTLALVHYISGEQKYADKAVARLRSWFSDPATRMNPNFEYAQIRKGHNGDNGTYAGVLDGFSFVSMLDAVALLELREVIPQELSDSMQLWFSELSEWMLTSENGIKEGNANNNHAIAYDTQVIRYAMYGDRDDIALSVIEAFPKRRLEAQIEEDGRMPAELARTIAFYYSRYNIDHMLDICDMAAKFGVDLYQANNRAIERAIDWLLPYSIDQESFPYQQINSWESVRHSYARLLHRASKYGKKEEYRAYYQNYKAKKEDPLFEFLYL